MKQYRQSRILAFLERQPAIQVQEVADELGASVATIRRDLSQLESQGFLRRVHGGAFAAEDGESGFIPRFCCNSTQKRAIGRAVGGMIAPEQVIFIDGGTTTEALLPFLRTKSNLTVFTCGLNIAQHLLRMPYIKTILLGGEVLVESRTMVGKMPVSMLECFGIRFDLAVIGCSGVSAKHGATNRMLERLPLKRRVLESSETNILVADSSKLGRVCTGQIAHLIEFTKYVTESGISPGDEEELRTVVELTVAEMDEPVTGIVSGGDISNS